MEFFNHDVVIPGDQWEPKHPGQTTGYIAKVTRRSKFYPEGRFEIYCIEDKQRYLFPVHTFPKDWILSTQEHYQQRPGTPKKSPGASPARGRTGTRTRSGRSQFPSGQDAEAEGTEILAPIPIKGLSAAATHVTRKDDTPPAKDQAGGMLTPVTQPSSPATSPSPARRRSPRRPKTPKSLLKSAATPSRGMRVSWRDIARHEEMARTNFTVVPRLPLSHNFMNFLILLGVALPALLFGYLVSGPWSATFQTLSSQPGLSWLSDPAVMDTLRQVSEWGSAVHPLLAVNVVMLLNVDVLFWVVAQLQGTTWLIDPYWTLIPVFIGAFYRFHPSAVTDTTRDSAALWLVCGWSARLTYSYFRREEFQFGAREDWRYTDMGKRYRRSWWLLSFLATYLVQHLMLVGVTLPLYTIYTTSAPWSTFDTVATAVAAIGALISFTADNQLRSFMVANERKLRKGEKLDLLLNTGLWRYSRHPNYFGEQMFWWGLALFSCAQGQYWVLLGPLFNSLCMIPVTVMTEQRMLRRPERRAVYEEYRRRTSVWVPLPPSA